MSELPFGTAFSFHAQRNALTPALCCDGEQLDWGEFDARANRLARAFAERGVGRGDYVSIVRPNAIDVPLAVSATWKLGAVPNPVPVGSTDSERAAILELVRPALVYTGVGIDTAGFPVYRFDGEVPAHLSDEPLPEIESPYCRALCSGGSTGRPKVIVDTDPARCDPARPIYTVGPGSRTLVPGPLHHSGPFLNTFWTLLTGGFVALMPRFDAERALALIERHRIQYLGLVPTMMQRIWRLPAERRDRYDLSSLERVVSSGAPCPEWLMRAWIDWLGPERLVESYGATERIGGTLITGSEWLRKPGSVGKPTLGREIRIVDPNGQDLPPGDAGEVLMRPARGREKSFFYLGADASPSRDGWYALGDMGWLDEDGYLFLADRKADMIISGGVNLYPAEIESALQAHKAVLSCAVIGLPDEDLGERAHAIVQSDRPVNADELRDFLRERIAATKIPKSFEFVDYPLRDDAGKVRKAALRAERLDLQSTTRVKANG